VVKSLVANGMTTIHYSQALQYFFKLARESRQPSLFVPVCSSL
jgi:hypothetical protein